MSRPLFVVLAILLLPLASGAADEKGDETVKAKTAEYEVRRELVEELESVTQHRITIEGVQIPYTAKAGNLVLREEDGKPKGSIFFVAYTRDDVDDLSSRPLTFSFNGGPGSASLWVHLGAFGPKKTELDAEGFPAGPPPGRLVDNPYSVLDFSDLVFIDPVATGFSRAAPGVEAADFHGFQNDIESVGEFIRLYLTRNGRWSSPKFLAGESYGTTRSAGLAGYLQNSLGTYFNGIALISSVLNWQTLIPSDGNDLPYIGFLPSYTATAWYHGRLSERLSGDLQATLAEVEEFSRGEYATALMMGRDLAPETRAEVVGKLAEYTGLTAEYIEQTNLRVHPRRFFKELLRDERKTTGRLDSRFTGRDRDAAGENYEFDPAGAVMDAYFVSLLLDYLRQDLKLESDLPFRHLSREVRPWNYHPGTYRETWTNRFLDVSEVLREAMNRNPRLQVLVMSGYYDLATPYFASDFTIDHMALEPEVADNIWAAYYEAGHMMYIRDADHRKFRDDFRDLVQRATRP
ncbi:MAG: peptidase S10 [Thermoanaerobaculia bacterium]